ncbi:UNVERIFIED_CONTAM: hypothetical protein K2H54_007635 [Gekko kuhli]
MVKSATKGLPHQQYHGKKYKLRIRREKRSLKKNYRLNRQLNTKQMKEEKQNINAKSDKFKGLRHLSFVIKEQVDQRIKEGGEYRCKAFCSRANCFIYAYCFPSSTP